MASRVREESRCISSDVRKRVLRAVKQMGYQPNMYANRLVSYTRPSKELADKDVIGVGFDHEEHDLSRIIFDHPFDYILAFSKLHDMGYRRIETVLIKGIIPGSHHVSKWHIGYLYCQNQIPVFQGTDFGATEAKDLATSKRFGNWIHEWKVDAVLSIAGGEMRGLRHMNLRIPEKLVAYLSTPQGHDHAGIDERTAKAEAIALESVSAQISYNEFGIPTDPATTLIQGRWHEKPAVRQQI